MDTCIAVAHALPERIGVVLGVILALMIMTRERTQDVYLPGRSRASSGHEVPAVRSMPELFKDLFKVLTSPMSLVIIGSIMLERVAAGMLVVVGPLLTVNQLGFSAAQFGQFFGLMTGTVAFLGLAIGPLVDQFGGKRILLTGMFTAGITLMLFGMSEPLWTSVPFFIGMAVIYLIAQQAVFIGIISQCMNICWAKVAATQFAVYMALSNLGRSIGARVYGGMAEQVSYADTFLIVASGMVLAAFVLMFFSEGKQRLRLAAMQGS